MENPVKLLEITDTRNPEVVRLTLMQEVPQKTSIGILMKGHPNVSKNRRLAWVPMNRANISEYGLDQVIPEDGLELTADQFGVETMDIVVQESHTPRSWVGSDGEMQLQTPKARPVQDGDDMVIMIDNKPIFRNTLLSFNDEHAEEIVDMTKGTRSEISMTEYNESDIKQELLADATVQSRELTA
tara:strand:+ start:3232 stop:3786 length:555 start_codon:yes stop_codon:yes gene_type:complete